MNKKKTVWLLLPLLLLAGACAKDNSLSTGEKARLQLVDWMARNHPGVQPLESGIYLLENEPGSCLTAWSADSTYTYLEVTIRALDGTVSSTTEEHWAKQLGTYSKGNYYGPRYMQAGSGVSYAGVDALLSGMRLGGSRTAIVPAWLLTTSRYDTQQQYIDACSGSAHSIYTVRLHSQNSDMVREEADSLRRYVTRHFGAKVQSSSYSEDAEADGSFYFLTDSSAFAGTAHVKRDSTYKLNYTGRLLNGQVFDTTDERTAKDAGIYSASKSYEPVSVYISSTLANTTIDGNTLITGFQGGLSLMYWKGQKATVLFSSAHGYTTSGSGDAIPPYSPLLFELELVND